MRAGLISLACLQLGFGGRNREGGVGGRRGWMYTFASPGRWFARRSAFFPSLEPPPVGLACFSSSPRCSRSRGRSYRSQRDSAPRSESARIQEKNFLGTRYAGSFIFVDKDTPSRLHVLQNKTRVPHESCVFSTRYLSQREHNHTINLQYAQFPLEFIDGQFPNENAPCPLPEGTTPRLERCP